jgi:hypothetical protein
LSSVAALAAVVAANDQSKTDSKIGDTDWPVNVPRCLFLS